jgi:MSHA pilin protein MshA
MSKQIQRGFTLIELIVVIVILGILAAFAVPRFMGLENEARVAAVNSLMGSLKSTAAMAHGICMAQACANGTAIVPPGGVAIVIANGYPSVATIDNGMEGLQGFVVATAGGGRRFMKTGARDMTAATGCWIRYHAATAAAPPTYQYAQGVIGTGVGQFTEAQMLTYLRTVC